MVGNKAHFFRSLINQIVVFGLSCPLARLDENKCSLVHLKSILQPEQSNRDYQQTVRAYQSQNLFDEK